jgi:hypothetical protein
MQQSREGGGVKSKAEKLLAQVRVATVENGRRQFLGSLGGVTGASLLATTFGVASGGNASAQTAVDDILRVRIARSYQLRLQAANFEQQNAVTSHPVNGDSLRYSNKIANFSKGLPHNNLGEVDVKVYKALVLAVKRIDFAGIEALPLPGTLPLINPLGGQTFDIEGPDAAAISVAVPPTFDSAEQGAELVELYWMALTRDIPFENYPSDPLIAAACADLSSLSSFKGPKSNGQVTSQTIFRGTYLGCLDGPLVSQLLLQSFALDGRLISGQVRTALPGRDHLTLYDEWLASMRGFPADSGFPVAQPFDPTPRYRRSARDLGQTACQDTANTLYFSAALILATLFNTALGSYQIYDAANPYKTTVRQTGFASFGAADTLTLLGSVVKGERSTFFQKWNVHLRLRPEAYAGRVHNQLTGAANYPLPAELLSSPVLASIFAYNRTQNQQRFGIDVGTYLLPELLPIGCPTNPSYPAGHGVSAGACVTLLKAYFDESLEIPNPVKPSADGLSLLPYVVGVDGPPLTIGGELNKLAANVSIGRDMAGIHWRSDDLAGNLQGEEVAIRILKEARTTYIEPFNGYSLTKFDGTTITI